MDITDLILLGIVIASNNLSFSFGLGALGTSQYHLRIILIFTVMEFTVPLIGIYIGSFLSSFINEYAQTTASLILIGLGIYTIITSFRKKKEKEESLERITSVKGLIVIALGLSIDNLLVGFSLGLRNTEPLTLATFIAFFSMLFTFIGLKTGKFIASIFGQYVEIFAGIVLIILGVINF